MRYQIIETKQAREDIRNVITYILEANGSKTGALNFLNEYDKSVRFIENFPMFFKTIDKKYKNSDIRIKYFKSHSIVFLIDDERQQIVILRVLSMKMDRDTALSKLNMF